MVELIVIHIHKTGGVSLLQALEHVYGKSFSPYSFLNARPGGDSMLYTDYETRKRTWDEAVAQVPEQERILMDHMPVQLFDGLLPKAKRITWLRDPVHRVISSYIYDRWGERIISRDCSIQEFINLPEQRNVMTFFTAGGDLDRFFFMGITEYFAHDLAYLAGLLGWPPGYPTTHDNVCMDPDLKEKLLSDPALVSEIERLNQQDCELYRRALRRTDRR